MCTGHDDTASREEVARLSRRGFLRARAAATAAAVGTSAALAAPALAARPRGRPGTAAPGPARPDQHPALHPARPARHRPRGHPRRAGRDRLHPGRARRLRRPHRRRSSGGARRARPRATSGHVGIPQPFDAATWQRAARRRATSLGIQLHRAPVLRGQLRHRRRPDPRRRRLPRLRRDLNKAGRWPARPGSSFGYHNHHCEFFRLADGPSRTGLDILTERDRPGPRAPGGRPVLGVPRRPRPGRPDPRNRGRIRQVTSRTWTSDGSFADPGPGPDRLRPDLRALPRGRRWSSTSWSATTPAPRRGPPPTPWPPPRSATTSSRSRFAVLSDGPW